MSSSKKKFLANTQYSVDRPPPPLSAWPAESTRVGDTGRGSSRNPFDLSDRIAVVTGAGRGIGRAVSERLATQGAHVIVTDLNDEGCNETVATIRGVGGSAEAMHFDVTDQAEIDRVCAATIAGHGRIDILINNAGICLNAEALKTTRDIWERQMFARMKISTRSSTAAAPFGRAWWLKGRVPSCKVWCGFRRRRRPSPGPCSRTAFSKAGVAHLSKVLGWDRADTGVHVNAIAPGFAPRGCRWQAVKDVLGTSGKPGPRWSTG